MQTWFFSAGLLLVAVLSAVAGDGAVKTWSFEDDAPGTAPKGFTPSVGDWKVMSTDKGKVLAQSTKSANSVFNIALVDNTKAKDVDISVNLKASAGDYDQGGGLVWRAKDAKNYYIARFNHKEDNFRVYKVVKGVRSQPLQNADVTHHDGWAVLRVTMKGDHIECYIDGKKHLDVHDSTFIEAGKIGVWSKADARSQFDDLTLSGN
jgi:hypothetical protein